MFENIVIATSGPTAKAPRCSLQRHQRRARLRRLRHRQRIAKLWGLKVWNAWQRRFNCNFLAKICNGNFQFFNLVELSRLKL